MFLCLCLGDVWYGSLPSKKIDPFRSVLSIGLGFAQLVASTALRLTARRTHLGWNPELEASLNAKSMWACALLMGSEGCHDERPAHPVAQPAEVWGCEEWLNAIAGFALSGRACTGCWP